MTQEERNMLREAAGKARDLAIRRRHPRPAA